MAISFSCHQLIFGNQSPALGELNSALIFSENEVFSHGQNKYIINSEVIENKYFWLYIKYGDKHWSDEVLNEDVIEQNPRSQDTPELNRQVFCMYSVDTSELYLNDFNKKTLIQSLFKSKISKEVRIKNFVRNPEDFIRDVQAIGSISFVAKNDLFGTKGDAFAVFPDPEDLFGLGVPDKFRIQADFSRVTKTESFRQTFLKFIRWKDSRQAESFVCVGYDDKNMQQIFNPDGYVKKITLDLEKNSKELFDQQSVKVLLIDKIRGS